MHIYTIREFGKQTPNKNLDLFNKNIERKKNKEEKSGTVVTQMHLKFVNFLIITIAVVIVNITALTAIEEEIKTEANISSQ